MSTPTWLPARLDRATYSDGSALEAAAWAVFQRDFSNAPTFRTERVNINRKPHPARANRQHSYWHAVTEGQPEEARTTPETKRLERMPWARPVIENEGCPQSSIKVWSNRRNGSTHVCIWFDQINYLVVLKQLPTNYLLKTTYSPESRRKQQLHKEYAAWKKSGARL
jgi:hypothetical protein